MKKQYKIIKLSKSGGKFRTVYAPSKDYKEKLTSFLLDLQQKIHDADTDKIVHGFLRGRGPVTNALKHVGHTYTLSLDLEDFFDSVKAEMVEGYLSEEQRALCFIDGIARQGLPTSPLIANLAFLKVDRKIKEALAEIGAYVVYTRYADDLIFSFNAKELAASIEASVEKIVRESGFVLNSGKTSLQSSKGGRRMITGIAVGERHIYPSRKLKRQIRAALHQQNREQAYGLLSWAECREPQAFYTDRDLLNKNIFHDEALDISNDFYLSDLLSFEAYVKAVESNFDQQLYAHEIDPGKWKVHKEAFMQQRATFYQNEKARSVKNREHTRRKIEQHFAAAAEEKEEKMSPQQKTDKQRPLQQRSVISEANQSDDAKVLNVDFDALKEIEQVDVNTFQDVQKARRRQIEEIQQAKEQEVAKKRSLNKLFAASIVPIFVLIGVMSYYFSATKVEVKAAYPLIIQTEPYDARVQIMNIIDAYRPGIELKPGEYDIRISKEGYETQRFTVTMGHEVITMKRELKVIKKRKVY